MSSTMSIKARIATMLIILAIATGFEANWFRIGCTLANIVTSIPSTVRRLPSMIYTADVTALHTLTSIVTSIAHAL